MTDKAILNELLGARAVRRDQAQRQAQKKREAFMEAHPDYRALCETMAGYPAKLLSSMTSGGDTKERAEALKREYAALKEKELAILKKAKLSPDAFLPRYTCEKCADTGYIGMAMCDCLKADYLRARAEKCGFGGLFESQSFESFELDRIADAKDRETMGEILSDLRAYAEEFTPKTAANLLFLGGTGVGKTHLSSAIGKTVLERGYEVLYDGAANVVGQIERERFQKDDLDAESLTVDRILDCELLILDDLGTELSSRNTANILFHLINSRLVAHRPMILSTNLSPKELEARYGERLTSRLLGEFELYPFCGKDQRRPG